MNLPTHIENTEGFHQKYVIAKADGSPVDPNAVYLVLRIDPDLSGDDEWWRTICRVAARRFANSIRERMPQLADGIKDYLNDDQSN